MVKLVSAVLDNFDNNELIQKPKKVMTDRRSPTELGKKRKSHEEDLTKSTKKKLKTKESDDGVTDEEPKVKTEEEEAGDFSKFAISKATINTLQKRGVTYLFPIQSQTFNAIYEGKDVIAQARTGTGKTLSFSIPLVERLLQSRSTQYGRTPRVLVMAPTRELARQVCEDFEGIGHGLSTCCVYGGTPYGPQVWALKKGVDLVVGTPGRIMDLLEKKNLNLSQLKHVVLDEMDRMLDMGFEETINKILEHSYSSENVSNKPQTLLFSATVPDWVHKSASKYLAKDYQHINLVGRDRTRTATTVQHLAIQCEEANRMAVINDIVQVYSGRDGNTLIFTQTKLEADTLGRAPLMKGRVQVLHGDIAQQRREQVLKGFRKGQCRILVATDVAARGLDIPEVDLVIQCTPPKDIDSYIHRSGRTGRAGRTGRCICFYTPNEIRSLKNVERTAKITFKRIGPPTAKTILSLSEDTAAEALEGVSADMRECFEERAKLLIEEKGGVECVAAALVLLSGTTQLPHRSLITCQQDKTTYTLKCTAEMDEYYAKGLLQSRLTSELSREVTSMQMCADKKGCVFDVPSRFDKRIAEKWQDDESYQLNKTTELPNLAPVYYNSYARGNNSTYGGRGSGSWGRGGGFRGSYRGGQSNGYQNQGGHGQHGQMSGGYRGGYNNRGNFNSMPRGGGRGGGGGGSWNSGQGRKTIF